MASRWEGLPEVPSSFDEWLDDVVGFLVVVDAFTDDTEDDLVDVADVIPLEPLGSTPGS